MTKKYQCGFGGRVYNHFKNGCKGHIIGVFSSAVYCRLESGDIVLFHDQKYGIIPFGIGFKDIRSFLSESDFTVDSAFECKDFILTEDGSNSNIVFQPVRMHPSPFSISVDCLPDCLPANISAAESVLRTEKPGCIGTVLSLAGQEYGGHYNPGITDITKCDVFSSLLSGILHTDSASVESALLRLVGLGYGLTPTMDDIITGLAYIFRFLERQGFSLHDDGYASFLKLLTDERILCRTSEISAAYISSAACGESFSLFDEVAAGLLKDSASSKTGHKLSSMLEIGSDSGGNILIGIIIGLNFLIKK